MSGLSGILLCLKPNNDEVKVMYADHSTYHSGDSGLDLFFPEDINLPPKKTTCINLKIQCEALKSDDIDDPEEEFWNVSYYLYPRSSISRTPLRMANSIGIIDSGYRGNLKVVVDNIGDEVYTIHKGDRLFQICAPDLGHIRFELVDELSASARGAHGFGSTGGSGSSDNQT